METLLALAVGGLFGIGLYMMMRRSIVKLIIGLVLLGHAANLLLFTVGGLMPARAPFVPEGQTVASGVSDPVPQALILTAIVIGFGLQAFAIILIRRAYQSVGTDDLKKMRTTDRIGD